jgi:hypothetical protein
MRTRALRSTDIPALQAMAAESGLPYPDLTAPLESVVVVVDAEDQPVMAGMAEKRVQGYLLCGELGTAEKLRGLRMLHAAMADDLGRKGYREIDGFLPPAFAEKFGRRLERSFGWVRNWPSWAKTFGARNGLGISSRQDDT